LERRSRGAAAGDFPLFLTILEKTVEVKDDIEGMSEKRRTPAEMM
jgi:hypothetical protein